MDHVARTKEPEKDMPRKFWVLSQDMDLGRVRTIGSVITQNGHDYTFASEEPHGCLIAEVYEEGKTLDFATATMGALIVRRLLGVAMAHAAPHDVRLIDTTIDGDSSFGVVHVMRAIDCLDKVAAVAIPLPVDHPQFGSDRWYEGVYKTVVDAKRIPDGVDIFRLKGWRPQVLVSSSLREAMETVGCVGADFRPAW